MAMSLTAREDGKNLVCAVCREVYRSPRLLPCFHTFCLDCLEGLMRTHGRSFPCPHCRKPTTVPPDGALGFQMNFYITEEELERERKRPKTAMCATHEMEPLVFFCVQCEQAICIRCRLTKHSDHHNTQDLSEAAARCADYLEKSKERLDSTISFLSQKSTEAQENLRAAKQKGAALKEQVQAQHDVLIRKIGISLTMVLGKLEKSNTTLEARLAQDAQVIQNQLDSLVQLRQSVHHALTADASDADKVSVEKEMREGMGNDTQLHRIRTSVSATTLRPGLHRVSDFVSSDDIHRVLGDPVTLTMSLKTSREVIVPVFRCMGKGDIKEVYGLCQKNPESFVVHMWDPPTDRTSEVCIDEDGNIHKNERIVSGRRSHKRYAENKTFVSTFKFCDKGKTVFRLNSKAYRTYAFQVHHVLAKKTSVFRIEVSHNPFELEVKNHWVLDTNPAMPAAFDATDTGDVIALVEIPQSGQSLDASETTQQVCLYRRNRSRPFATYTPQDTNFCPSDVCFWHENNEDKLLVADRQNDCIHVVSIQEDDVYFERYLAAGDGNLIRPTALNVDDQGRVWIGCENGSVLRCETQETESQVTDEESAMEDESDDSASEFAWEIHSNLLVENSSRSTNTRRQVSEDAD